MTAATSRPPANAIPMPSVWWRRIAAILEIIGVFIGGTLAARFVAGFLNLGPANIRSLEPGGEPDLVALSGSVAANLLLRYGMMLGLAFAVGWWHRRRPLTAYGLTRGNYSVGTQVGIALLLFASVGLLPRLILFLKDVVPLGAGPQHWELLESTGTPGFWLYMAVSSFAFVPLLEELLARGYWQTRLTEDFGPAAAILMTALMFTLSHTQYFIANVVGVGMLVSLFVGAIAAAYVRFRTGSLLAVVIAHALGNFPLRGQLEPVVLMITALITVLWWRRIYRYALQLWCDVIVRSAFASVALALAVIAIVLAQVLLMPALLPVTAALTLSGAILMEWWEKRCDKTKALRAEGASDRLSSP